MKELKIETYIDLLPKKEYLEFIKNSKNCPNGAKRNCMLDSLKNVFFKNISKYKENSKKNIKTQMSDLVKDCNNKKYIIYLNNFFIMLCHFVIFDEAINIFNILKQKIQIDDLTIINYIKSIKIYKDSIFTINEVCNPRIYGMEILEMRIKKVIKKLNININSEYKYLDLCCGDGSKTNLFASRLNIKNIYGTDIQLWGPYNKNRKFKFDFRYILKDKLMYDNESFDLITCFLSLHHIPNLTNMLNEIHRILKPNGLILILEHDLYNYHDKLLVDIQHKLFGCLYDNNMNCIDNPVYSRYFNFLEWDFIFRNTGKFQFLSSGTYSETLSLQKRYDSQFYGIYKRRDKDEPNFSK